MTFWYIITRIQRNRCIKNLVWFSLIECKVNNKFKVYIKLSHSCQRFKMRANKMHTNACSRVYPFGGSYRTNMQHVNATTIKKVSILCKLTSLKKDFSDNTIRQCPTKCSRNGVSNRTFIANSALTKWKVTFPLFIYIKPNAFYYSMISVIV